uniref:hypothetical protein n=1 Tax=Amycolatopsis sp. CA-096443 TaxID=3239919 RepID=UPI003F49B274
MVDLSRYADDLYDGPQLLLDRHVPLIWHETPRFRYITAVCVGDGELWRYQMPTVRELETIASFHDELVLRRYGDPAYGWLARQRERHPFDIDGAARGRYLAKYESGGWGIKRPGWHDGPVPAWNEDPMSLVAVLDRAHVDGDPHWAAWKAARPGLFGR